MPFSRASVTLGIFQVLNHAMYNFSKNRRIRIVIKVCVMCHVSYVGRKGKGEKLETLDRFVQKFFGYECK